MTLETRRLQGDLIKVVKIFKGFDDVKPTDFFTISSTGLRGHEFKLYKPQAHLDIRKKFYRHSYWWVKQIARAIIAQWYIINIKKATWLLSKESGIWLSFCKLLSASVNVNNWHSQKRQLSYRKLKELIGCGYTEWSSWSSTADMLMLIYMQLIQTF